MSRVRVKICGITQAEDARAAIDCGADALGFNTWREGRRYLDVEGAAEWVQALPPFVTKVALTVNAPIEEAERIARLPFIDALQLHGDEDPEYCRRLAASGRAVIKALRVRTAEDLLQVPRYPTRFFLIDAHVEGQFGGTGSPLNLELAAEFRRLYPELSPIVAGGLRPENVAAAIQAVRPYAVDVSSGVESAPGRKDIDKMRAFIRAAHGA